MPMRGRSGPRRNRFGVRLDAAGVAARTVDGVVYASKLEARTAGRLEEARQRGEIAAWQAQPCTLDLRVGEALVARYRPDFEVVELDGTTRIVECKGMWTPDAKLKWRLFRALYPSVRVEVVGTQHPDDRAAARKANKAALKSAHSSKQPDVKRRRKSRIRETVQVCSSSDT